MTHLSSVNALMSAPSARTGLSPWGKRLLGNPLLKRVVNSESHGMFAIDTASNWLPKMLFTVRSLAEAIEVSFLEFVESGFFYYAPHNVGQRLSSVLRKLSPHLPETVFSENLLFKPLAEVRRTHPDLLRHIVPVKAGLILASVGAVGVAGEYALSFLKNLITMTIFKTGRFSDVANLTQSDKDCRNPQAQAQLETQNRRVKNKIFHRLKQVLGINVAVMGLSAGIARFGLRLPSAVRKLLEPMVNLLDFEFKRNAQGKMQFGLGRWQTRMMIGMGVVSYLDASRDRLEFWEIFTRVACVVAPYLAFGKETFEKILLRPVAKHFPALLETSMDGKTPNIHLKLSVLEEKAKEHARALLGAAALDEAVAQKAGELIAPVIQGKNLMFLASFLIGTLGVGIITTLIAQHFTRLRFANQQAERAFALAQTPTINTGNTGSGGLRPIWWAPPSRLVSGQPTPHSGQAPVSVQARSSGNLQQ